MRTVTALLKILTNRRLLVGLVAALFLSIGLVAACSGGGGGGNSNSSCNFEFTDSSLGSPVYVSIANPGGSVSASECSAFLSGANGDPSVTVTQVSSLPSGLNQACTGNDPNQGSSLTYTVYDDGSGTGDLVGTAVCTSIGSSG